MAENKNSFLLYTDTYHTVEHLSDEQAGQLFKHILSYVNDKNPKSDNPIINIAFEPIKQSLKRDLKKYEARAERSRKNGSNGGRPPKEKPKKPSGLKQNPDKPKKPDSDSDNVSVNVSVSDSDSVRKKNILMSSAVASDLTKKNQPHFDMAKAFYQRFEGNMQSLGVSWNHLKKITAEKFTDPIRLMMEADGRELGEVRRVWGFLGKDDFWMQNVQSSKSLRKNFDQLVTKATNAGYKKERITDEDLWRIAHQMG